MVKRQLSSFVIATAVLTGSTFTPIALNEVHAATVQQKQTVFKEKVNVNGQVKELHFISKNKVKLYSAQELAKILGAGVSYNSKTKAYTISKGSGKQKRTQVLKADSTSAVVNGKKVKLAAAPKLLDKKLYVTVKPFVQSLGGDSLVDGGLLISTSGSFKFTSVNLNVDGQLKPIHTISMSGKQFFSAGNVAKLFSALVIVDKNNQVSVSKKGKITKIGANPFKAKGIIYADLNELVKALKGDIVTVQNGKFISTGLLSGDTYHPQWVDNATLLLTNENGDSDAVTNLVTLKSKKSSFKINDTNVVVSPNGKQAVYADESGVVYLVDLQQRKVKTLNNTDDTTKLNFVWSKDGSNVYFISGDKSNSIASLKISDGSIKTVYSDSLNAKSDLQLSPNGKKLIYTVEKEGTTVYTDPDKTDVSDIDLTGTESQLYVVDVSAVEVKAVALTASPDNKVFPAFLKNGNIIYTSYDDGEDTLPVLNMLDSNNVNTALVTNQDIISTAVTAQGKVLLIADEDKGYRSIFEVNTVTRKLTRVAQTKIAISDLSISPDGKSIAVTVSGENGDRIFILKNGKFEVLTK